MWLIEWPIVVKKYTKKNNGRSQLVKNEMS